MASRFQDPCPESGTPGSRASRVSPSSAFPLLRSAFREVDPHVPVRPIQFGREQRRPELALRLALGAVPRHIMRLVLQQSALLVTIGVTLGLGATLFAMRVLGAARPLTGLGGNDSQHLYAGLCYARPVSRREIWEKVYTRFEPFRPADNPAWRVERLRSPATKIIDRVAMPFGDTRAMVTGTIGTGKSTEMLRIAEARSTQDFVVVLDLRRHFAQVVGDEGALLNVSAWEVVFLAGLAVLRSASELLSHPVPESHITDLSMAWEKVAKATGTPRAQEARVDAGALAKAMIVAASTALPLLGVPPVAGAAGLKVLEAAASAVKWSLPVGQAARARRDQDVEMQTLLKAVNVIIGYVQSKTTRILLIIDGLDRITDHKRAEALFIESEMIAQLECRVVVSGPFALRSSPAANAVPRFNLIEPLVNEPVMDHRDPQKHGPGIGFLCDLYRRRTDDLGTPDLIAPELLEKLAYYSGGRARDFVKLIRSVAEQAWVDNTPAATEPLVNEVLDDMRKLLETGLDVGHIKVLEEVMKNPRHLIPSDGKARELLSYGQLLPYPNESEWYYPHPLLTMHLLRPTTGN